MKKIWKTKFRNLETGKIVSMWPTTDHHQVNYNLPVWVDKTNYCYGQCDLWPVPLGYEPVMPINLMTYKNNMKYTLDNYKAVTFFISHIQNDLTLLVKYAKENKIATGMFTEEDFPKDKYVGIQTKWRNGDTFEIEERFLYFLFEKE